MGCGAISAPRKPPTPPTASRKGRLDSRRVQPHVSSSWNQVKGPVEACAPPCTGPPTLLLPPLTPPVTPPMPPPDFAYPIISLVGITSKFEDITVLEETTPPELDAPGATKQLPEVSGTRQFREGLGPPLIGEAAAQQLLGDVSLQSEVTEEDDWDNVISIELGMKDSLRLFSQTTSTMASSSGSSGGRLQQNTKNRFSSSLGVVSDAELSSSVSDVSRTQDRGDELSAERMSVHDIEAMVVDLVEGPRHSAGPSYRQRQLEFDGQQERARKRGLTLSSADDEDLMDEILKDLAAGKGGRHSVAGDPARVVLA